jgi:polysulfide reductase chain C
MATYLFLGGIAGGAYLISALVDLFKGDDYEVLSKSGALVSTVAVIASVVVLLLEIRRFRVAPLSFLYAFSEFPGSMISVGTWILTSLLVVSVVTVILAFFGGNWLIRKIVDVVGIVLSLGTAAYTGLVLSYCRGIPFWSSPFLPALFTVSGILTGLTMAMLMIPVAAYVMPKALNSFWELYERRASYVGMIGQTEKYCQVLTVVEIALLALYIGTTPTTGLLLTGSSVSLLFYVYIALGLLLPLGIGYLNSRMEHKGKDMMIVLSAMIGQVLVLLGGFILRYVVLVGGQLIH